MESSDKDQGKEKITEVQIFPVPFALGEIKETKTITTNTPSNASKEKIINQAFKFHSQGNISEAAKYYQHFANQGFKDYRVFSNHGVILKSLGKLQEAELSTRKAIKLNPNYAEAHSNLGIILKDLGNLKQAEISYRKAIELNPDFADAHSNLGNLLKELGNLKQAELSQRKAIQLNPDCVDAHLNLGSIWQELGNLKQAELSTRKAIELNPNFAMAHSNLGSILMDRGKSQEAELSTRKAIELNPDFAKAYFQQGVIMKRLGRYEEAIASFNHAYELETTNATYYGCIGLTVSNIFRESLTKNNILVKSINQGDWEESKILLEKICRDSPKYTEENVHEFIKLWCDHLKSLVDQGSPDKLLPILLKIIVINERNNNINNLIKYVYQSFDLNLLHELADKKDKILLNLGYSQYKFLIKDFLEAEFIASRNIKEAEILIKEKDNEDLGWMITRRSLELFKQKHIARNSLTNLINHIHN